ncbi:hypothetical protein J6590_084018 [Homalodisca vitripennis]|nr:hypothetical protein J6590_084018 [Homalodisca vitripennis]
MNQDHLRLCSSTQLTTYPCIQERKKLADASQKDLTGAAPSEKQLKGAPLPPPTISCEFETSAMICVGAMPPRKKWKKEDMLKAVNAVKIKDMGYLKASKTFIVPRCTLENYVNHPTETIEDLVSVLLGKRPFLGTLEAELVTYCKTMDQRFYGLRRRDIRILAYQLARKNKLPNNFTQSKGMAGEKWLKGFLGRNPSLAVRTPRAVTLS